jgi:hypothetical protein
MYNSDTPSRAELPTTQQLVRSTLLAAVSAAVLLVAVVLPAEYGVDPTGIGRVLRMTDMGNIKQQLAAEAAADAAATAPGAAPVVVAAPASSGEAPAQVQQPAAADAPTVPWRDELPFTLAPGQGIEVKLRMAEGGKVQYLWTVEGGVVNFDTHGDALGKSISYEKGRGVSQDEGVLEAAFTGNHGWFWRNRGDADVKVILRTRGDYIDIKKVM